MGTYSYTTALAQALRLLQARFDAANADIAQAEARESRLRADRARLQEELEAARGALRRAEVQQAETEEALRTRETTSAVLGAQCEARERTAAALRDRVATLAETVAARTRSIDVAKDAETRALALAERSDRELAHVQSVLAAEVGMRKQLESAFVRCRAQLSHQRTLAQERQAADAAALRSAAADADAARRQADDMRGQAAAALHRVQQLESERQSQVARVAAAEAAAAAAAAEATVQSAADLKAARDAAAAAVSERDAARAECAAVLNRLLSAHAAHQTELQAVREDATAAAEAEVHKCKEELARLQAELASAQELATASLHAQREHAERSALEAAQQAAVLLVKADADIARGAATAAALRDRVQALEAAAARNADELAQVREAAHARERECVRLQDDLRSATNDAARLQERCLYLQRALAEADQFRLQRHATPIPLEPGATAGVAPSDHTTLATGVGSTPTFALATEGASSAASTHSAVSAAGSVRAADVDALIAAREQAVQETLAAREDQLALAVDALQSLVARVRGLATHGDETALAPMLASADAVVSSCRTATLAATARATNLHEPREAAGATDSDGATMHPAPGPAELVTPAFGERTSKWRHAARGSPVSLAPALLNSLRSAAHAPAAVYAELEAPAQPQAQLGADTVTVHAGSAATDTATASSIQQEGAASGELVSVHADADAAAPVPPAAEADTRAPSAKHANHVAEATLAHQGRLVAMHRAAIEALTADLEGAKAGTWS